MLAELLGGTSGGVAISLAVAETGDVHVAYHQYEDSAAGKARLRYAFLQHDP